MFECGHGKYWYLGDRVLPQVEHKYPPTTIPTPPCHTIRLADFLADEEITRARDGYIVAGVEGNYSEFICKVSWLEKRYFFFPYKVKFLFYKFLFHIYA